MTNLLDEVISIIKRRLPGIDTKAIEIAATAAMAHARKVKIILPNGKELNTHLAIFLVGDSGCGKGDIMRDVEKVYNPVNVISGGSVQGIVRDIKRVNDVICLRQDAGSELTLMASDLAGRTDAFSLYCNLIDGNTIHPTSTLRVARKKTTTAANGDDAGLADDLREAALDAVVDAALEHQGITESLLDTSGIEAAAADSGVKRKKRGCKKKARQDDADDEDGHHDDSEFEHDEGISGYRFILLWDTNLDGFSVILQHRDATNGFIQRGIFYSMQDILDWDVATPLEGGVVSDADLIGVRSRIKALSTDECSVHVGHNVVDIVREFFPSSSVEKWQRAWISRAVVNALRMSAVHDAVEDGAGADVNMKLETFERNMTFIRINMNDTMNMLNNSAQDRDYQKVLDCIRLHAVNHRISLAEIETRTKIIAKNIHPIMDTLEEREECTSYMIGRKRWYDFSAITTNEDAPVEPETPQQQENE